MWELNRWALFMPANLKHVMAKLFKHTGTVLQQAGKYKHC